MTFEPPPMPMFVPPASLPSRTRSHVGSFTQLVAHDKPITATAHASVPAPHGKAALRAGKWFKLICGASAHDVATIRNLSEVYATAGADCIDVAADAAVIRAALAGMHRAVARGAARPLLMASVSDSHDVHFRKALFDASRCPRDCPRPCERVCPADAIALDGVIADRCYGCGRCVPVCPLGLINTQDYVHDFVHVRHVITMVDAVEIHTGRNHLQSFRALWDELGDVLSRLDIVAVSFPDLGGDDELADSIERMWHIMEQHIGDSAVEVIWQTDGRPMSGDIGAGTASAAVQLAGRVRRLLSEKRLPGHVQLAGGTNWKTVPLMDQAKLLRRGTVDEQCTAAGVAMGGYARKIVKEALGSEGGLGEEMTTVSFNRALDIARTLVNSIKDV